MVPATSIVPVRTEECHPCSWAVEAAWLGGNLLTGWAVSSTQSVRMGRQQFEWDEEAGLAETGRCPRAHAPRTKRKLATHAKWSSRQRHRAHNQSLPGFFPGMAHKKTASNSLTDFSMNRSAFVLNQKKEPNDGNQQNDHTGVVHQAKSSE